MEGLRNLNKVILVGRLTQTPELRYTPKGVAVARLNIAVNQKRNKKTESFFIDVIALNKLAEFCSQYFHKGKGIYIEGSLSMKKWTADDKTSKTKIEVIADRVSFLEGGEETQPSNESEQTPIINNKEGANFLDDEEIPF